MKALSEMTDDELEFLDRRLFGLGYGSASSRRLQIAEEREARKPLPPLQIKIIDYGYRKPQKLPEVQKSEKGDESP